MLVQRWDTSGPALSTEMRADDLSGRIVRISDGDTISVMHGGQAVKIRLYGIDAPERGQSFGNKAKQFVSAVAFGKESKSNPKAKPVTGGQYLM